MSPPARQPSWPWRLWANSELTTASSDSDVGTRMPTVLSLEAYDDFVNAIANPRPPTQALIDLFKERDNG